MRGVVLKFRAPDAAGRRVTIGRERLIRLLRMTASGRDAEALIGKTNAMLKGKGASRLDVIGLPAPAELHAASPDCSYWLAWRLARGGTWLLFMIGT